FRTHTGMVIVCFDTKPLELFGKLFASLPRQAVNDTSFTGIRLVDDSSNSVKDIRAFFLLNHLVSQIRSIEALLEFFTTSDAEIMNDINLDIFCCCCCQCHYRYCWKTLPHITELFVIRAEVMSPLTDTVRFVNDYPC